MTTSGWSLSEADREAMALRLTGAGTGLPGPGSISHPGGGGKFDPSGRVLDFPGNTFLCHLDRRSHAFRAICAFQDDLAADPLAASCLTFLPQASFHMTVFCGVSGHPLESDGWPRGLRPGEGLAAVNAIFLERLAAFRGPERFRLRPDGFRGPHSLTLTPDSPGEEAILRGLRRALEGLTGIHRSNPDGYRFHISLAYLTRWVGRDEAGRLIGMAERLYARHLAALGPVDLGPVEFCTFRDMYHFQPLTLIRGDGVTPD